MAAGSNNGRTPNRPQPHDPRAATRNLGVKVGTLVFRFDPNLETCTLNALILVLSKLAEFLHLALGQYEVKFVSTANTGTPEPGQYWFNVGGYKNVTAAGFGHDQHGCPENERMNRMSSLGLLFKDFNVRLIYPAMRGVLNAIEGNELVATKLGGKWNVRELITAISAKYGSMPELALEFGTMALAAIFSECLATNGQVQFEGDQSVFGIQVLRPLVAKYYPTESGPKNGEWWAAMAQEAIDYAKWAEKEAHDAITEAIKNHQVRRVQHPLFHRSLSVIVVRSLSYKVAAISRFRGFDVCVHLWDQPDEEGRCHWTVSTRVVFRKDDDKVVEKMQLEIGQILCRLRIAEARKVGKKIGESPYLNGFVRYEDGTRVPIFCPEFRNACYNGTSSSPDVERCHLDERDLINVVCSAIPASYVWVIDPDDDNKRHVQRVEAPARQSQQAQPEGPTVMAEALAAAAQATGNGNGAKASAEAPTPDEQADAVDDTAEASAEVPSEEPAEEASATT